MYIKGVVVRDENRMEFRSCRRVVASEVRFCDEKHARVCFEAGCGVGEGVAALCLVRERSEYQSTRCLVCGSSDSKVLVDWEGSNGGFGVFVEAGAEKGV